jgi:indolepyruvate ferredoxin oxidoreductase
MAADPRFNKTQGREVFTGNELILKGALEAGVDLLTGYPGSPVADVFDAAMAQAPILKANGLLAEIAGNEALSAARLNGAQLAGLKAMAVMKSVGFNVAADGLFTGTLAKQGHEGGGVIVVGDDPWNDSTQVPQDSRRLSDHLLIPSLEPATFQEVKDFIPLAFELSRRSDLYVSVIVSTNLADGGAVVDVAAHPGSESQRRGLQDLSSAAIPADKTILLPPHTGRLEKDAYERKFPLALQAARDLGLNKLDAGTARLGFVAAGLPYAYLCEMLRECGLEGVFPILRLGMTFPIEPEAVKAFVGQLDEVIVIENKRPFIEAQIRDLLVRTHQHGQMERIPAVWGKDFPDGFAGVPAEHGMNPSVLLKRLGPFLRARGHGNALMEAALARVAEASGVDAHTASRTATFCSGCPHRDSSSVFLELAEDLKDKAYMAREHQREPVDLVFHGDAGCYSMLFLPPNQRLMQNYSGMGLGGGSAAGLDPFVRNKNVTFIGDGTFFHSGLAAVSDSIKNNADLLYVILDNKTTAMTGHQPHNGTDRDIMGNETFAQDCETALRGLVKDSGLPVIRVNPERREEYRAAVEDLILLDGPKFVVADKECGITYHRRQRRARAAEELEQGFVAEESQILINEDACEFCLECTVKTGCPGLDFTETLHGPKLSTHQTHCVSDGACARVKACPSFEKVTVRRKQAPAARPVVDIRGIPEPTLAEPGPDGVWRCYVAGIGGMGIGATTALLVRAAMEMGYDVQFCDKKGIAIRGGGVYSHVVISKQAAVRSPVHPYGTADLLVGVDLLEAARSVDSAQNLRVASPQRTACVLNLAKHATTRSLMGLEAWSETQLEGLLKTRSRPAPYFALSVSEVSQDRLGSTLYDNSLLMGAAYQMGLLPVTGKSLHRALKMAYTGLLRSKNIQAFNLGRDMVAHPERYGAAPAPVNATEAFVADKQAKLAQLTDAKTAAAWCAGLDQALRLWPVTDDTERQHLALSSYELCLYEDLNLGLEYLARVIAVAAKDSASSGWKATKAAARGLYKVTAIKDEVWVSHLLTSPEKYERDLKRLKLDPKLGDTVEYEHFNRPHFDILGMKFEFDLKSRDWMLRLMKRAKFLRRLLPAWHAQDKAFRDWYVRLVEAYPGHAQDPDLKWATALGAVEKVRGYRAIRYKAMDECKGRAQALVGARN